MIKELPFDRHKAAGLRDEIYSLRDSEDTLVIRGGARELDRDDWVGIITGPWELLPDRRHFDPKWAADYAQKHRIVAQAEVAVAGEFDTKQQLAPADWWEVSYQPDRASAYSYSKTRQPMHNDSAWFADSSEVNFFIMQKQARIGGEQMIYPLSRIVEDLSAHEPGLLHDLTHLKVTVKKGEGDYFNETTIIDLGPHPRISWNYYRTEKPTPEVKKMCDALFQWFEKQESTPSVERLRCETGDVFVFNDNKLVHGRTAFEATEPYERVLLQSMWRLPAHVRGR